MTFLLFGALDAYRLGNVLGSESFMVNTVIVKKRY